MMEPTNINRIIGFILLFTPGAILAQEKKDSIETRRSEELIIRGQKEIIVKRLPDISGPESGRGKKMKY
jgi:hypothetical protein